jgi:hypothetical protein
MSAVFNYENMMKLMEEKRNEIFKKLMTKDENENENEEQEMTEFEEHKLDEVRGNFD